MLAAPGELVVLTGEEGCGTTSLLRTLDGALLTPPPGDEWADADVVPASPALDDLGAGHLVGRELWTLSNGERQRVRLAAVLDEPVLLLDEPLGALDAHGVRTVLTALRARADTGAAVLVVAKDDERAVAVADRVLVLSQPGGLLRPL